MVVIQTFETIDTSGAFVHYEEQWIILFIWKSIFKTARIFIKYDLPVKTGFKNVVSYAASNFVIGSQHIWIKKSIVKLEVVIYLNLKLHFDNLYL